MENSVLEKVYDPTLVEERWGKYWIDKRLFTPSPRKGAIPFSIVIPPPNVTGSLHMGHALNITLQDLIIRYRKMSGFTTLWLPGTDHAGIATQNVVERLLAKENLSREVMGREKFLERVWKWKEESGGKIINQLKRLGAACDWTRERFTMDEGLSRAVRHAFVGLYKKGLIYRGNYMINWCPRCHTALSDLEVEHEERRGKLYFMKYPCSSGKDLIVATTRPETMLGDTAVAVHPDDERYAGFNDVSVELPLTGRSIPVIFDSMVDPEFGTGAVKITPAHDPNDFQAGITHNLEVIRVIDEDGFMTEEAGEEYRGLDRFACRKRVVEDLEAKGLLVRVEDYTHNVGHCYRCKTVIEPSISLQWFVKVAPLARKAIVAVKEGKTRIIPETWEKTYFDWMYNIRDWCISRQIWWGHRIPAWHCSDCGGITVEYDEPTECAECGGAHISRESDVLDTWFSSALWPFSTMGWPDHTQELGFFYPTSVLVTGFDILFFWVARMMMMGLEFMGDVPFRDVFIHALVRDGQGQKMSKTRGNVIDPLEVMDRYGTDAFRFTLVALAAQGRDIKMSEDRIAGYRNFMNKLWNSARFVLMNLEGFKKESIEPTAVEDRWIVSRFEKTVEEVKRAVEEYRFNEGAAAIYHFLWHEYCDWYIEIAKPFLFGDLGEKGRREKQNILLYCLEGVLKLIHPITPFISEEIWNCLPGDRGSILLESFPENTGVPFDEDAEETMGTITSLVRAIRNMRRELHIAPGVYVTIRIRGGKERLIREMEGMIKGLARVREIEYLERGEDVKNEAVAVVADTDVYLPVRGILDFEQERMRILKEIKKVEKEVNGLEKKLSNPDFLEKAPRELVKKNRERRGELESRVSRLRGNLSIFTD